MYLIFKVVALLFLAGALVDGAFDYSGFDPWDSRADLPSGYFTLLRISVSAMGAYVAWELTRILERPTSLAIVYGGIAVLFQPLVKVSFDYETWQWINLVIFVFIIAETLVSIWLGRKMLNPTISEELRPAIESKDAGQGDGVPYAIKMAKFIGADNPRKAAEITMGRELSDLEWAACRKLWERNW